jgi:hypothetical protein
MTSSIDETPLDSLHYQIIQECAATIVAKFHARAKRLETLQKLQQWPQKLQSLQQGNLQELIKLMQSQAEQLRAQNSEGCQRLLDLLNATKGSLNETIQELKTLLEAEEKRSFGQMKEIAELKVAMSLLESRLSAAEHRNAMNEQMLRCAQESLANQDSGGGCTIM